MASLSQNWREREMTDIKSMTLDELTKEMEAIGEKKLRAAQI